MTKTPTATKAELRAAVQANNPLDGFESNTDLDTPEAPAMLADPKEQLSHISESGRAPKVAESDRIWIILDDNDEIPPGGQFVGANGVGYTLMPGVEAHVPRVICEVLDRAIKSVPVQDPRTKQIVGWKDRKRFPYTILQSPTPKAA